MPKLPRPSVVKRLLTIVFDSGDVQVVEVAVGVVDFVVDFGVDLVGLFEFEWSEAFESSASRSASVEIDFTFGLFASARSVLADTSTDRPSMPAWSPYTACPLFRSACAMAPR